MKNHGRPENAAPWRTPWSWQGLVLVAYALLLGACATGPSAVTGAPDATPNATTAAAPAPPTPDRSQVRTVRAGFEPRFCSVPSDSFFLIPKNCSYLPPGTEVVVTQRIRSAYYYFYHVLLSNNVSGYIREDQFLNMADDRTRDVLRARAPSCAKSGDVSIGMTRELVSLCWGEPRRIVRTESRTGVRERLIYRRGTVFMLNDVVDRVRTVE